MWIWWWTTTCLALPKITCIALGARGGAKPRVLQCPSWQFHGNGKMGPEVQQSQEKIGSFLECLDVDHFGWRVLADDWGFFHMLAINSYSALRFFAQLRLTWPLCGSSRSSRQQLMSFEQLDCKVGNPMWTVSWSIHKDNDQDAMSLIAKVIKDSGGVHVTFLHVDAPKSRYVGFMKKDLTVYLVQ